MKIKRLDQMKFNHKMLTGFGTIVFFMVLLAIVSLYGTNSIHKKVSYYMEQVAVTDTAVKMCRIQSNNAARNLREMALEKDMDARTGYQLKADEGMRLLEENLETLKGSKVLDHTLYQRYEDAINTWMGYGAQIEQELLAGNDRTAVDMILTQCSPSLQTVIDIAKEIDGVITDLKEEVIHENEQTILYNAITICVLLVLSVVIAVALAKKIVSSILIPMRQLENASTSIANGNFHAEITYQSEDEMGTLADNMKQTMKILSAVIDDLTYLMNEMANGNFNVHTNQEKRYLGQLRPVLDAIRRMNSNLSDTMRNINHSSEQVATESGQVASNSQSLAQGAAEQASSVDELVAMMNNIAQKVQKTASHSEETNTLTQRTGEEVRLCTEKMGSLMDAMNDIGDRSEEIKKIIKAIEDIAFQTNILSLNAAVEAARAGEAGKGFSIVADEVRNLASKSAEASKSTSSLIEDTIRAVDVGSSMAKETGESLKMIAESSKPVVVNVNEIAQAAKQQADSIEQVSQGLEQISSVVQTNSATAQESAAVSEELSSQSQVLKDLMSQFVLKEV